MPMPAAPPADGVWPSGNVPSSSSSSPALLLRRAVLEEARAQSVLAAEAVGAGLESRVYAAVLRQLWC